MLIFLDVETTGVEPKDRICALGSVAEEASGITTHADLVKPPLKIRPDAMAVHHITNEAVAGSPAFMQSSTAQWLQQCNIPENVLVGHNVGFDLTMLQKEGLVWQGGFVDTLKCARHLMPECDQYGLQYLRYELGLYKKEAAEAEALGIDLRAHDALADAYQVRRLYGYLLEMADAERLQTLTTEPVLITKFSFGKHKGRYIEEVAMHDRGYLEWMLNEMFDMDEDLRYSVEYFLRTL